MYLSKLVFSLDKPGEAIAGWDWARPYSYHQWLWQLFSEPAERADFLFRLDSFGHTPVLHLLSQRPPKTEVAHWQIDCKPFAPRLAAGDQLQFSLRANPVVTHTPKGQKPRRHDVLMHAKKQATQGDVDGQMHQAAHHWLQRRADKLGCVIALDRVQMDNYQQHRLAKPGGAIIQFSSLDYSGLLQVSDPQALLRHITQGIGPAKRFGCGLLLVRRV